MDRIYEVTITGLSPLIMHNGRLANPIDKMARAMKVVTKKKQKTDADYLELANLEFQGGLYYTKDLGPYIPTDNLMAVLIAGAKKRKLGNDFKSSVSVVDPGADGVPLIYKGPRDPDAMFGDGTTAFVFTKGVKVGTARVMRTRPIFETGWSAEFQVEVTGDDVTEAQVKQALEDGGLKCGLGDYRPRYGRFAVTSLKEV